MALQKLGKYEIVSEIGRGAMGVVYKAFDPILEREVALKTMMASMGGMDGEGTARFYREARSAAKLTHRNIVTIYDMGEEQGIPYIAMEFLDGVDLHRKMKREGPLPMREALDIVRQVLHGLHYAHQFQIVHRDIKPANIYILKNSTAKILDFGIAKLASSEMTRTGMVLGTVDYMSPEQIRADKGMDGRSDLFSVGVILYELLVGRKPFPGETITQIMFKIVHDPPGELTSEREIPPRLIEISGKALEKEPGRRFQNGEEFACALDEIIQMIDAEVTTMRQLAPVGLDLKSSVSAARRLFEGGSFEESAAILKKVLVEEPGHKEATELFTLVDRRVGGEQTVAFEQEPEPARPSAPRGSRIEEILAEIEEERKTSPAAAGRSEKGVPDLTLRLEDSGVKKPKAAGSPAASAVADPATETLSPEEMASMPPAASAKPKPSPAPAGPPPTAAKPATTAPRLSKPAPAAPVEAKPAPTEAKPAVSAAPVVAPEPKPAPPPPPPPVAAKPAPVKKEAKPAPPKKEVKPAPKPAERITEEIGLPERAAPGRVTAPPQPKRGVSPMLIGGGVAAVAVVAIAAWLILGRGGSSGPTTSPSTPTTPGASTQAPVSPTPAFPPPQPAPAAPVGYLAIDAQPWAEVASVREAASGRAVGLPSEPGRSAPTTPLVLDLPAGRYEIILRHPDFTEVTVRDLSITAGQWTRVNQSMPGFKPKIPAAAP